MDPRWLADPELGAHVCAPHASVREYLDSTAALVRAALARGRASAVLTHTVSPQVMEMWLEQATPGFAAATGSGQLQVASFEQMYLHDGGAFDTEHAIEQFLAAGSAARAGGFDGLLAIADMAWSRQVHAGVEPLLAYEAAINRVFPSGNLAGICQYDRALFGAQDLAAICAIHPLAPDQPELHYELDGTPPVLTLTGGVDSRTIPALNAILALAAEHSGQMTIDISGVALSDSTMAAAVALANAAAARSQHATTVVAVPRIARLLNMIGADGRAGSSLTVVADERQGSQQKP
jgi:anti-anti-sigma regulatory factor